MSSEYENPDSFTRAGIEWPGMVEFAEKHLGCNDF